MEHKQRGTVKPAIGVPSATRTASRPEGRVAAARRNIEAPQSDAVAAVTLVAAAAARD
ncbi:hypothetical protein [Brucella intermedia]|uniref:hypothetical protein n=1 Tax=Brucella intermedia TaxID=94625 RepID=UPI0018AAB844|nr:MULTISPECIES: hypothetical protein [Brucella/Ochrobactrum group]